MKKFVCVCHTIAMLAAIPTSAEAVTIDQMDNFNSGRMGWHVGGGGGVNGPVVIPVGGPDGAYLNYTTDTVNTGGRFLILNTAQWTGDYLAAGVTGITAIAKNDGDIDLHMRLLLEGPGGGFLSQTANALPVGGDWQNVFFPISADALTGGNDLASTLSDVVVVRIFHNPAASFPGPFTDASMSIDTIQAVPEPGMGLWFFISVLGMLTMIRHRDRRPLVGM